MHEMPLWSVSHRTVPLGSYRDGLPGLLHGAVVGEVYGRSWILFDPLEDASNNERYGPAPAENSIAKMSFDGTEWPGVCVSRIKSLSNLPNSRLESNHSWVAHLAHVGK